MCRIRGPQIDSTSMHFSNHRIYGLVYMANHAKVCRITHSNSFRPVRKHTAKPPENKEPTFLVHSHLSYPFSRYLRPSREGIPFRAGSGAILTPGNRGLILFLPFWPRNHEKRIYLQRRPVCERDRNKRWFATSLRFLRFSFLMIP